MKKYIVITSIFEPTEAVKLFAKIKGYQLIVVGDKKSPKNWKCDNVIYLSIKDQDKMNFGILKQLPYNHYCRKMVGYLYAIQNKPDFIIDTDDDNIPKENWTFPKMEGHFDFIEESKGFINVYQAFTKQKIWPRGLPLNFINNEFEFEKVMQKKRCKVGIWQGLADEDPDVDAIYRLTNDTPCFFDKREPLVLGKGTISPFNTQNTIIRKELFPLLYLPTHVTFRFTDILRGLIAQPIMWLFDYQLGFIGATVVQKRNVHDYMKDFLSEIPMYQYAESIIEIVINSITKSESIETNFYNAYKSLLKQNIVCKEEIVTLETWLNDLNKIKKLY